MAKELYITGYNGSKDLFQVLDEDGESYVLDFSDVENWYKKAVARRELEEKKFAEQLQKCDSCKKTAKTYEVAGMQLRGTCISPP